MKRLMILGGITGFLVGLGFGWPQGNAWSSLLFRACVAAYLAGLLLRWWGHTWLQSLHQVHSERHAGADSSTTSPTLTQSKS